MEFKFQWFLPVYQNSTALSSILIHLLRDLISWTMGRVSNTLCFISTYDWTLVDILKIGATVDLVARDILLTRLTLVANFTMSVGQG